MLFMRDSHMVGYDSDADVRVLDGWWMAQEACLGGVRLVPEVLPDLTLLLFNGAYFFGEDQGTVDINHHATPATMDVLILRGPNRWRFIPAVFEHTGRVLRICYDLGGGERPPDLTAPAGTRRLSVTYHRAPVHKQH